MTMDGTNGGSSEGSDVKDVSLFLIFSKWESSFLLLFLAESV